MLFDLILGRELARWRRVGRRPVLWWRDDDARAPTPQLERLIALSTRHRRPLTVAAIPDGDLPALAVLTATAPAVALAVHGFRHRNRAPLGDPSGEVIDGDDVDDVAAQVAAASARFAAAGAATPLFVPPWNNIHTTLLAALPAGGVEVLSGFDGPRRRETSGLRRLDAHLDVMRWGEAPRFRGRTRFLGRLRRQLAERRRHGRWSEPIGLLTHHLDHDPGAWRFLDQFLAQPAFDWRDWRGALEA